MQVKFKNMEGEIPSVQKDENKEILSDSPKEEVQKATVTASQLFDLLGSLREVLSRSTNICVEEREYKSNGYGPKPWVPVIVEEVTSRYSIILVGADRIPYVIKNPLISLKIERIDDLITEIIRAVKETLTNSLRFVREPPSLRMMDQQRIEPEKIGFPYTDLLMSNMDVDLIHNAVHRFLNPTRRRENFNYSDGYVFNGSHIEDALRESYDVSQREMRILADTIEREELRTRKEIPDDVAKPIFSNNVLFEIVMNPFIITSMFDALPRRMRFSSSLVIELQKPDVQLGPIDANTLQKTASVSLTKSMSVTSMFSIDYTPDMSDQISAFIMSLIVPGLIEFDVDLSDINVSDHALRALTGALAKLLFSRNDSQRWNNITHRGARVVEQTIVDACVTANVLAIAPHPGPFPLNRVNPVHNVNLTYFDELVTDGTGKGWREGNVRRYAPHPPDLPYATCCNRQRYVHDIESVDELDQPDRIMHFNAWNVATALSSLLSATNKHGEGKSSYAGIPQIFKLLANRIFDFYAVINEYNALNWYTSLRLSEESMDDIYSDGSEEPTIITINGKTILYLAKSLCKTTSILRRVPYLSQAKAECALARDCVESAMKNHIINEVIRIYEIPDNSFKRSDIVRLILPDEGPLYSHLCLLLDSGLASTIGPFYECIRNSPMYDITMEIANTILNNPIDYGILPSIELATRVCDRSVRALELYAINNRPYTNIGTFEEHAPNDNLSNAVRTQMSFRQMQPLVNTFNLQQTIRDLSTYGVVNLSLPFPYTVDSRKVIDESRDHVLDIMYDAKRPDNNLRHCLKWRACSINITDVERQELRRPDLYILNFSTINRTSIPDRFGRRILMSAIDWLNNLDQEVVNCVYVRTDNVVISSVFERV